MDLDIRYYHGLAGGIPFWESEEVLEESLKTLKLIFKLGGIYCRGSLKKFGIDLYNQKDTTWNGDDYISICIDNPSDDEFAGENYGLDPSFFRYAKTKIAIEFKSSIIETCVFRQEPYRRLPGERQVYQYIDISNISRILVGIDDDLQQKSIYEVSKICEPHNIPVLTFLEAERYAEKEKSLNKKVSKKYSNKIIN